MSIATCVISLCIGAACVGLFRGLWRFISPKAKVLLHTKDSFEEIWVLEKKNVRSLHFQNTNSHIQSCFDVAHPKRVVFLYQKMILMATALIAPPQRICILGLGGGTLTMHLRHLYPQAYICHIEINPRMKDYAIKFFGFQEDENMEFIFEDAATFFFSERARTQLPFDLMILDAFDSSATPTRFFHRGFYQTVLEQLTPDGLVLANTCYHALWKSREEKLYQQIFSTVLSAPPTKISEGNRILLAWKNPYVFQRNAVESRLAIVEPWLEQMDIPQKYWHPWLMRLGSQSIIP